MTSILWPMITLVLLTAVIWVLMYIRRLTEVRRKRINPQDLATVGQAAIQLENVTAAENFRNLLEVPVLFYVLCLTLLLTGSVTNSLVTMAWIYVILRVVHSLVHVTTNHVITRWLVYVISTICLFIMWLLFAVQLLT